MFVMSIYKQIPEGPFGFSAGAGNTVYQLSDHSSGAQLLAAASFLTQLSPVGMQLPQQNQVQLPLNEDKQFFPIAKYVEAI